MKWNFPTQQQAMDDLYFDMKIGAKQINVHAKTS